MSTSSLRCDHYAPALVNCLLNPATTSCTNFKSQNSFEFQTISSFRLYAFAFVRRHIHHTLLLPTPSITMCAGPKQRLLISVFRAQNSFSSLTKTVSLFLNRKESKSPARDTNKIDKLRYSTRRILERRCHADTSNLEPAHPILSLFSQLLISRNLQRKGKRALGIPGNYAVNVPIFH